MLAYALCMSGALDEARHFAANVRPTDSKEAHFWQWLGSKFGVGPYADARSVPGDTARVR